MKKHKEYGYLLFNKLVASLKKVFPDTEFEPKKQKEAILNLLFYDNFTEIQTSKSVDLFLEVKADFEKRIKDKQNFLINELESTYKYERSKHDLIKEAVKKHVNNPVFDIPVREYLTAEDFAKK